MLYFFRVLIGRMGLGACLLGAVLAWNGAPSYAQEAVAEAAMRAAVTEKVNINSADAATLARMLNGVGQSRAEEIVRYREAFGSFDTVEELAEVKGIGPATVERNRPVIVLE